MFVRSGDPFNYDTNVASDESGLACAVGSSLTKQSFAEEVDINTIVRRFGLSGELPSGVRIPQYADFHTVIDFHSAMLQVRRAEEAFAQLPASVRARFGNDAGSLVDFVSDEDNRDEAIRLGLVVPEAIPAPVQPVKVEVVAGSAVAAPVAPVKGS